MCGAGVVRKSMGTCLCAKGLIVQLNGSPLLAWDYCTAQCSLGIAQTVMIGVKRLVSVNDKSHIKISVVVTYSGNDRLIIAFCLLGDL